MHMFKIRNSVTGQFKSKATDRFTKAGGAWARRTDAVAHLRYYAQARREQWRRDHALPPTSKHPWGKLPEYDKCPPLAEFIPQEWEIVTYESYLKKADSARDAV